MSVATMDPLLWKLRTMQKVSIQGTYALEIGKYSLIIPLTPEKHYFSKINIGFIYEILTSNLFWAPALRPQKIYLILEIENSYTMGRHKKENI